jgi:putative membrane protein
MIRTFFLSLVSAGVFLCVQPAGVALAQTSGGAPSVPRPNTPDMGPMNSPDTMTAKVDDKRFLKDAALGGMAEVELGKLAVQKASRDEVKQFGQKMADDHSKVNDELKQVASKENVSIPDSLDSKHQSRIEKLSKLSGEDFDKAYVKDQLKDHEADVREFQNEAQNGSDPGVKAFASSTLPTLQQHLSMVKDLNKSEKKMASATAGR